MALVSKIEIRSSFTLCLPSLCSGPELLMTSPQTPGEQSLSGPPKAVARMLTMMMTTVKQPMAALYLLQSAQSFFRQVIRSTSRMQVATTLAKII